MATREDLVVEIYRQTQSWPKTELYGLTAQIRRASTSIPSNIAEGKGRSSDKELLKFLDYARGSVHEVQTQIMIACRLDYLSATDALRLGNQAAEVGRVLNGLIRSIGVARVTIEEQPTFH